MGAPVGIIGMGVEEVMEGVMGIIGVEEVIEGVGVGIVGIIGADEVMAGAGVGVVVAVRGEGMEGMKVGAEEDTAVVAEGMEGRRELGGGRAGVLSTNP